MKSLRYLKIRDERVRSEISLHESSIQHLETIIDKGEKLSAMFSNKAGKEALLSILKTKVIECDASLSHHIQMNEIQIRAILERRATIEALIIELKEIKWQAEKAKSDLDRVKSKIKKLSDERRPRN